MKGLKILAFVVGGIVVLAAAVLVLALMPSVQTWAVRKAVAGQPGMEINVSKVAAGFSDANVTDLRFVKDGMVITAKGVSAKYSAWDYITSKRINADSVTIDELVVDLRNAKPSPTTPATGGTSTPTATPGSTGSKSPAPSSSASAPRAVKKDPFQGLLKEAQLPFDVRVASLTAKGRALLPGNQIVTFDLKGAGIETGQRGKLEWTIDFADSTAGAALRALRATGNASVHIATDRRIDSVEIETIAAGMGPKVSADQVKLTAKAEKPTATGDETYALSVSLVKASALEPIVKTTAQYISAAREIAGAWEIALRTDQLAGLLAGLGLPELAAKGAGKFSFKPDTNAVAASGNLEAQSAQLQKFVPQLAAIGTVQLKTAFDGSIADNVARLDALNLEIAGADGRKFAQISSLQKINYQLTEKRVTLADPKSELARISLQTLPLAWAQSFVKPMIIDSGDLSMVLAVEAEPDGSRIRTRAIEPLAIRTVTIRQGDKKLVDRVSLTVRPTIDYSATKLSAQFSNLSITMPAGDTVTGVLSAEVTNLSATPVVAFTAQLQAKVIEALKPYLPVTTGPLAIVTAIEGRHEGQILQLAKTSVTVNRENGELLTSLELQQPVRADLKASTFTVPTPTATVARIKLGELPLAWAEPYVAKSKLGGSLKSGTLDVAMRTVDDVTLTTAEPLVLSAVTVTMDSKPMLQNVDLLANLSATKRGESIAYDVRKMEIKQGQTLLAALNVTGEAKLGAKMTFAAKGNLEADAATLMTQPVLAPFATLSRGRVTAAFDTSVADTTQAKAVISAKNLVAKQDNRPLGDLEITLSANVKADGSGTISAPITLTNANHKSDVSIDGAFGKSKDNKTFLFTGKVASNQLVVEDFQPLAGLAPSSEPAKPAAQTSSTRPAIRPATTPTAPAKRDTEPFWNAVNGKFDLDLKRVVYGKDYNGSVRGTASITPSRLSLDGLEGKFKDKPFKIGASVTFAAQQAKPYTLAGSIDVNGIEVGPLLQAANPNEKPPVETTARVVGKFTGTGVNVSSLLESTIGQFDATGGKGTLRIISGKTGSAVGVASLLGGVLGAATGSNSTVAASSLLRELTEMQFDQFAMRIDRGADLNLKLTSLEFLSPSTRITGTGSVTHQPNVPIANQPIQLEMRIAGKQHMLRMLDEARVLGEEVDEKGYGPMRAPFKLNGTVSQMQDNLWSVLLSSALDMRSDLQRRPVDTRTNTNTRLPR